MNVLVVNEPFVPDFCRTQRWAARTRGRVLRAPDWLAYATAVLEKANISVELYDFPARDWYEKEFVTLIQEKKPDWVVLDCTTPSVHSDIQYAKRVKDHSDAKVIFVGPHSSIMTEETLRRSGGAVDVIAIGEYDYTIRDIIQNSNTLSSVPGIGFLDGDRYVQTEKRALIENLDDLPFPAWHHLDLMAYFDGGKLHPYIDMISGRGCPNRCSFCLWPQTMHGYKYRFRSPENVVDEIERDIELCPQVLKGGEFFFEDDTFTVNKDRAIRICKEIRRRKLDITFSVNARVDTADDDLFREMKATGCRELLVGFESGSQEILKNVHKGITLDNSKNFMRLAKKNKIDVHGCFVIGLPGESKDTIKQTMDFALGLGLHTIQFSGAVPFPGTDYFRYCEEKDLLRTRDWSQWLSGGEQHGVVDYPGLTAEEIDYWVDWGLKKFYFRPSYMLRFLFETRNKTDLYRKLRGFKNFINYLFTKK